MGKTIGFSVDYGYEGTETTAFTNDQTLMLTSWTDSLKGDFKDNIKFKHGVVTIKESRIYTVSASMSVDVTATWGSTYPLTDAPKFVLVVCDEVLVSGAGATTVSTGANYGPMILNVNRDLCLKKATS
jgi:hypothetical protein